MSFLLSNYPDWLNEKLEILSTRIVDAQLWATVWKQRAHLDNMRAFQWRKIATKRKELLKRGLKPMNSVEYKIWVEDVEKELELDAQRQADEYLESEDAHIEVTT